MWYSEPIPSKALNMPISAAERFGVSDDYWNRLSERDRALYEEIRPLRKSAYVVHHRINNIENTLREMDTDARSQRGKLELIPDFQRGHVWSQEKQIAFMETVARGMAPLVIRFNCPGWQGDAKAEGTDMNPHSVQCIDGLQRLTAMREFVAGNFKIFGKYSIEDLDETPFSFRRLGMTWTLEMFNIQRRADLLQFYLDLNSGGVVHSDAELDRVRSLRQEALAQPTEAKPKRRGPKA